MLKQKEFYFVRHGQTDYNLLKNHDEIDHPAYIPLNQTGRAQAEAIEPIICQLPIHHICASPMKRAQQTKEIVAARLHVPHHVIDDLSECTGQIWMEMIGLGMYSSVPLEGKARHFMDRAANGMDHALNLPGTALIVAHGGVHWALCCLLKVEKHAWILDNCGIVHFSQTEQGNWVASQLHPK